MYTFFTQTWGLDHLNVNYCS